MKIEIKNRYMPSVQFTAEIPDDTAEPARLRLAIEIAAKDGADLRSANLRSADLRGANLYGADLCGANLRSADLRSADLRSANLHGANLRGANLRSADLRSAKLEELTLVGERSAIEIGPIGSRADILRAWLTDKGVYLQTGCFFGTRDEFAETVEKTHGENNHGIEYRAALALIDAHARIWAPEEG